MFHKMNNGRKRAYVFLGTLVILSILLASCAPAAPAPTPTSVPKAPAASTSTGPVAVTSAPAGSKPTEAPKPAAETPKQAAPNAAKVLTKVRFMLPVALEPNIGSFGYYVAAQQKGYYQDEGLDVTFLGAQGAIDGAKQLMGGNADIGHGLGPETPIIARPQGIAIKSISNHGGQPYHSVVSLDSAPIKSPKDLKGKTIAIVSFSDTSYFVLLAVLANAGLTKDDVNIVPGGPSPALAQTVVLKKADAFIGPPNYIPMIEQAGLKPHIMQVGEYFPGMAQGMFTSDANTKTKGDVLKAFTRATLKGLKLLMDNSDEATKLAVKAFPTAAPQSDFIKRGFDLANELVHKNQKYLGYQDPDKVKKLQEYYSQQKLIDKSSPLEDLFTNEFLPQ